jgi:hypothetical protein
MTVLSSIACTALVGTLLSFLFVVVQVHARLAALCPTLHVIDLRCVCFLVLVCTAVRAAVQAQLYLLRRSLLSKLKHMTRIDFRGFATSVGGSTMTMNALPMHCPKNIATFTAVQLVVEEFARSAFSRGAWCVLTQCTRA